MKVKNNRGEDFVTIRSNIVIQMDSDDNVEYRISENKFGELVINKHTLNDLSSAIKIQPNVSNEILLIN